MFKFLKNTSVVKQLLAVGLLLTVIINSGQNSPVMAEGSNLCPNGNGKAECIWLQNQITGACMWATGYTKPWEPVEPDGICPSLVTPTPQPTTIPTQPQPVNTPIIPDSAEEDINIPISGDICPQITVKGYVNNVEIFSTVYSLISPAGETWSFGDLRVDELVFLSSEEIFLEETEIPVTSFTWVPNEFKVLRFRETKAEPTCKVRFLFVP